MSSSEGYDFSNLVRSAVDARDYAPGEVIVREGEAGDCMFVILEGEVDVSAAGRVVTQLGAGSLFGEMSMINDEPRSATVTAKTQLRLVPITRRRFIFLTEQTPFFALHMMKLLSMRLRRMNQLT